MEFDIKSMKQCWPVVCLLCVLCFVMGLVAMCSSRSSSEITGTSDSDSVGVPMPIRWSSCLTARRPTIPPMRQASVTAPPMAMRTATAQVSTRITRRPTSRLHRPMRLTHQTRTRRWPCRPQWLHRKAGAAGYAEAYLEINGNAPAAVSCPAAATAAPAAAGWWLQKILDENRLQPVVITMPSKQ